MTAESKLLLDEMLTGDIAAQLRGKSHDLTAVVEDSALTGTPDEELLAHATAEGRPAGDSERPRLRRHRRILE